MQTETPQHGPQAQVDQMATYARQTRNAVVTMAWIVGLVFALSVIGAIIVGVELGKVSSDVNTYVSNCASQGGTNQSC
jgi:hypothetical protein